MVRPLAALLVALLLAPAQAVTLVAAGDIADCGDDGTQFPQAARTAALVRDDDALVLTLGDHTYPVGAPREFAECFHPTWGRFGARLRPVPGNHEYMTANAAGYFGYFGARAGAPGRGWGSFEADGWHVIGLDSNVDASPGSPQYVWLQAELARRADGACTLAYWHHPVYSSARRGNDPRMAAVFALLHSAGAEIVLAAHDHLYERFAPQGPDGLLDPARGVRAFTVGTGGARLYAWGAIQPHSEFRDNTTHGVLRLTLTPGEYRWAFMPADGGPPRDSGAARCHR